MIPTTKLAIIVQLVSSLINKGFSKEYWDENYSEPMTMDCIGNAKQHVKYLTSFFALEFIDISSIVDLGFGHGYLFQRMLKAFLPYKACGIEPSTYIFEKTRARKLKPVESTKLTLYNEDLQTWCQRKESKHVRFDLGLCTSVLQYLDEEVIQEVLPVMARRIKYLYLTVPTDLELKKQRENLNFHDKYAISRSREKYFELISPHFTLISSKVWESRHYFDEETSLFSDLLYRI